MSRQYNFNNTQPINPVTGMAQEFGRSEYQYSFWYDDTHHYGRPHRNNKLMTLRTYRTGDCAPKLRKWKHWNS
ncbi:MAG: hypothetical protein WAX89_04410 [Alphaproteobacteria bacterium]